MVISFKSAKLEKLMNSASAMQAHFGAEQAKKIRLRLAILKSADNLDEVQAVPPDRRHELSGKYQGCFAVDLKHPYRLVFMPDYDDVPRKTDGGIDLQKVKKIKILEVEDYH